MRDFARGMRQGAAIGIVGVTLGAIRALLHSLRYPTQPPTVSEAVRIVVLIVAGFAIVGGIVGVLRRK